MTAGVVSSATEQSVALFIAFSLRVMLRPYPNAAILSANPDVHEKVRRGKGGRLFALANFTQSK